MSFRTDSELRWGRSQSHYRRKATPGLPRMPRLKFNPNAEDDSLPVIVPRNEKAAVPISHERVRRLRKHLVQALRALRKMKGRDHSISPVRPEPAGFAGRVARAAC